MANCPVDWVGFAADFFLSRLLVGRLDKPDGLGLRIRVQPGHRPVECQRLVVRMPQPLGNDDGPQRHDRCAVDLKGLPGSSVRRRSVEARRSGDCNESLDSPDNDE